MQAAATVVVLVARALVLVRGPLQAQLSAQMGPKQRVLLLQRLRLLPGLQQRTGILQTCQPCCCSSSWRRHGACRRSGGWDSSSGGGGSRCIQCGP